MSISLKELKKNRLTPAERFILETIEGVKPETKPNGDVQWWKDGKFLFIQDFKNDFLWVSNNNIWRFLHADFGLNYYESKELIKNVMYDYTNNWQLTISNDYF